MSIETLEFINKLALMHILDSVRDASIAETLTTLSDTRLKNMQLMIEFEQVSRKHKMRGEK